MNARNRAQLYFIDTNIFLRVFVKENEVTHKECVELLRSIEQKKIKAFTSSLVIAEIHHVMASVYHVEKNIIANALKSILGLSNFFVIDDMDVPTALTLFTTYSIKFTECLIASSKKLQHGGSIISYDKDFDTLHIRRIEPNGIV